jgi:prepilin-type N-terminal cleavage/methylation domain-containing protein
MHKIVRTARNRSRSGFTLVELMIVVGVIALLAAIALPGFVRSRENSLNSRFASDIRIARDAFIMYAQERGNYPPDVQPGVLPQGMEDYLKRVDWGGTTPLGGVWDWDNWAQVKGVSVLGCVAGQEQLTRLDRMIDDGNLNTGDFRTRGGSSTYISIIEGDL